MWEFCTFFFGVVVETFENEFWRNEFVKNVGLEFFRNAFEAVREYLNTFF